MNYNGALYKTVWTSGHLAGASIYVWAEGELATQPVDSSRTGTCLALDITDFGLHQYDGVADTMGVLCEMSK